MATLLKSPRVLYDQQFPVRVSKGERWRLDEMARTQKKSLSRLLVLTTLNGEVPCRETQMVREQMLFEIRLANREIVAARATLERELGRPAVDRYSELTRAFNAVTRALRALEGTWSSEQSPK